MRLTAETIPPAALHTDGPGAPIGTNRVGPVVADDGGGADSAPQIRVSRPLMPTFEQLSPFLRQIDAARFYTNGGLLQGKLQHALAAHFGLQSDSIGLAGSGTAAIIGLLLGTAGRAMPSRPLCVCPAYTFAATACAAIACGYRPYLADVDPHSWALDPATVEALPDIAQVGAVIVVAPYGRAIDLAGWQAFSLRTGVSVVVDAAASFDTLPIPQITASGLPVAISLHATKTLSTVEGGLMICTDAALMRRAMSALNFGFDDRNICAIPGFNGKISEYHAAVGLADLAAWPQKRAAFLMTAAHYAKAAALCRISGRISVNTVAALPNALFIARDRAEADRVAMALGSRRIDTRRWYGGGLHTHPAYHDAPRTALPVTEVIAGQVLGLPFSVDLPPHDVHGIVEVIARTLGTTTAV
ncbi:MAG: DegT/DnrJ/EryC1/StrS family aminotransferase [Paracoccaceae bacterium]